MDSIQVAVVCLVYGSIIGLAWLYARRECRKEQAKAEQKFETVREHFSDEDCRQMIEQAQNWEQVSLLISIAFGIFCFVFFFVHPVGAVMGGCAIHAIHRQNRTNCRNQIAMAKKVLDERNEEFQCTT